MTNKIADAANSPAILLIYRGAVGLSIAVLVWLATTFMQDREATAEYRTLEAKKEGELAVALERLNGTLSLIEQKYDQRLSRVEQDVKELKVEYKTRINGVERRVTDLERYGVKN